MGKVKSSDILALNKGEQKKVVKQTKNIKKSIKNGKIVIKRQQKPKKLDNAQSRGLIYLAHIPHGFYEDQMKNYFRQFGAITNIKLCRSRKTGNSKGYGYVEFLHPEVAKIAAETMNNYLMFKKRVVAVYVPYEKRPRALFKGKASTPSRHTSKVRREKQIAANSETDFKTHLINTKARLSNLIKKMDRLNKAGIDTDIQPIGLSNSIKQEENSSEGVTHTYQTDPYDSDIDVKIPLKKSKKSVKSAASKASSSSKKSKSSKSNPPNTTASNKMLLTKSLDSVRALLSSKTSSKSSRVKVSGSIKKVNKTTSISQFKKAKQKADKLKGPTKITKKSNPLDADNVKKIARELIRKQGNSLLNVITPPKRKPNKKKNSQK